MRYCALFSLLLMLSLSSCSRSVVSMRKGISKRSQVVIVVDPGHGGKHVGAHSKKDQYQEKSFCLITAMMLKDHLERLGYSVVMTRFHDNLISLKERADIANSVRADLFVSFHFNSASNRKANGLEVFYYEDKKMPGRSSESKSLATKALNGMLVSVGAKSRGVKEANLAVLRLTNMPAILVEGGFLTNPDELNKLRDTKYLNRLAWGVAKGIHQYIR